MTANPPMRVSGCVFLLVPLLLIASALPAAAIERLHGAVTLGYDRLTMRVPVLPDRQLRGPSLNLRGALRQYGFRLDAEARLRQLRTAHVRYDLRWLDLAVGHAIAERLNVGVYHIRFPMRLRNDLSASHRWRATGISLDWRGTQVGLRSVAGRLDGNGGGSARELGLAAEFAVTERSRLGAMRNEVRGRSGAFRYATGGAWLAHEFDFGLTVWAALLDLRLRPGQERMRTASLGLAQRIDISGRRMILGVEASRTTPRMAPQRMDVIRVGMTLPLGTGGTRLPLNSTIAAMQRRPNFLFGFFDTVAGGI